jgi:enamine deaminase RidA (YjgF/YER057c/UK114 family)
VEAPAGGRLLFVSGLTARRADGTIVGEGDIHAQTRQVYENLRLILAEVGGTLDDVVRTTTYLRRMEDQAAMHEVKLEVFGAHPPASTTVQIVRLYDERQLIEVEATAVVSS